MPKHACKVGTRSWEGHETFHLWVAHWNLLLGLQWSTMQLFWNTILFCSSFHFSLSLGAPKYRKVKPRFGDDLKLCNTPASTFFRPNSFQSASQLDVTSQRWLGIQYLFTCPGPQKSTSRRWKRTFLRRKNDELGLSMLLRKPFFRSKWRSLQFPVSKGLHYLGTIQNHEKIWFGRSQSCWNVDGMTNMWANNSTPPDISKFLVCFRYSW